MAHKSNKNYKKKKYYPKKHNGNQYPKKHSNPPNIFGGFFNGNLANGMNFGGKDHDLSGYVKREVFVKDQYGNVQKARETQFFNSSPDKQRILIDEGKNEHRN